MPFLKGIFSAPPEVEGGRGSNVLRGITSSPPDDEEYVLDQHGDAHPVRREGKKGIPGITAAPPDVPRKMVRVQTGDGEVEMSEGRFRLLQLGQHLEGVTSPPPEIQQKKVRVQTGDGGVVEVTASQYRKLRIQKELEGITSPPPEVEGGIVEGFKNSGLARVLDYTGAVVGEKVERMAKGEIAHAADVLFDWGGLEMPFDEDGNYALPDGVATVPWGLPSGEGDGPNKAWKATKAVGRFTRDTAKFMGRVAQVVGGNAAGAVRGWAAEHQKRQAAKRAEQVAQAKVIDADFEEK